MSAAEHDLVAIGCGPLNLGLAALASTLPELDVAVFDARAELRWHSGLMFDDAVLQLPFLADLVSLVDPTHPLSFLAYLQDHDRLYRFFIRERFHPTRREYEDYLRWAAARLPSVRFGHAVEAVHWDAARARFAVDLDTPTGDRRVFARDLVIGIGTAPALPAALAGLPAGAVIHAADYLAHAADLARAGHVTVVGSGQSGAEIMLDLLERHHAGPALAWLTRTPTFAPLDDSKLVLEMTTPAYLRYFHGLAQPMKDRLVAERGHHYKGISIATLERLHDALYRRELDRDAAPAPVELRCGAAVESATALAGGRVRLRCRDRDSGRTFEHTTERVIAATGYQPRSPDFLHPLEPRLRRDGAGRYQVHLDHSIALDPAITGRIFVANAELHSHGVAAPDLGIGAYRNATILNAICGREVYRLPARTTFTHFASPPAPPAVAVRAAAPEIERSTCV